MDKPMPKAGEKPQEQQEQQAPGGQPKGPQADPKVVNAFQRVVAAAGKVIYERQMTGQLLNVIRSAGNPVEGVVGATMMVLDGLTGKVKGIHPNFVYVTANVVALMLLELAEAAKLVKFDKAIIDQVTQGLIAEVGKRDEGEAAPAAAAAPGAGATEDAPHGEMPAGGELEPGEEAATDEEDEEEAEA